MRFSAIDSSLFFSRRDPNDVRFGDLARPLKDIPSAFSPDASHFILAGYPDDEGIRINGGRAGAAHAPPAVRKPFYKMTPALLGDRDYKFEIHDLGDLDIKAGTLEERHSFVSTQAKAALAARARWMSIGGGHDYGFADADAFLEWTSSSAVRPLVINFDAHLDVRPTDRGLSSGTPFFRMLEKHPRVDFVEIGLQAQCNSRAHLDWVRAKGARVLMQDDVLKSGHSFLTNVTRLLEDWIVHPRPTFLSVDIDGFSSAFAPGCSQSWATGFTPHDFFPCLDFLLNRLDVRMLGIYEVSPPLDQDDRTSKLAAQILHRFVSTKPGGQDV